MSAYEYSGYESAFVPTSAYSDFSSDTERKTDTKSSPAKVIVADKNIKQSGEKNVLNGYRSITYNFTFAGLKKEYLSDPILYRKSALDLVILKSGGKGTRGITPPVGPSERENATA